MQSRNGATLFSASDLVNFMGCAHATVLDLRQLIARVDLAPDDEQARLLQEKGLEHERAYLERLKTEGKSVAEIVGDDDIERMPPTPGGAARGPRCRLPGRLSRRAVARLLGFPAQDAAALRPWRLLL